MIVCLTDKKELSKKFKTLCFKIKFEFDSTIIKYIN